MPTALRKKAQISHYQSFKVPPARWVPGPIEDARLGLLAPPRHMPPKYFYDARGSQLFDAICDTPEYYPTRIEATLLAAHAEEIIAQVEPDHLIELGAGTARKTRHLLSACTFRQCDSEYWPFDVCAAQLAQTAAALIDEYPWLTVNALAGDYLAGLKFMPQPPGNRLWLFIGSTLGNFAAHELARFLDDLAARIRRGDALLLGVDRVKDPAILHAAYNDRAGVTAAFNLNLLQVLNRDLDANFTPENFSHVAEYNEQERRIEMYLHSRRRQRVELRTLDTAIVLRRGERILTEISRKFEPDEVTALLAQRGLTVTQHHAPADGAYSLFLAQRLPPDMTPTR